MILDFQMDSMVYKTFINFNGSIQSWVKIIAKITIKGLKVVMENIQ